MRSSSLMLKCRMKTVFCNNITTVLQEYQRSDGQSIHFLKNFLLRRKMSRLTLTLALSNIFITETSSYCSCSRSCTNTDYSSRHDRGGGTQTLLKRHLIFERESLHVHTHESSLHQERAVLLTASNIKDHVLEPADRSLFCSLRLFI